ncbi:MAG: hypothetical protein LBQ97_00455 [Fusobacteriaceae bacterium]|jgi:hypothetical protein|nr:hypothetical protein [Fusobacteriaceae bacterium]
MRPEEYLDRELETIEREIEALGDDLGLLIGRLREKRLRAAENNRFGIFDEPHQLTVSDES